MIPIAVVLVGVVVLTVIINLRMIKSKFLKSTNNMQTLKNLPIFGSSLDALDLNFDLIPWIENCKKKIETPFIFWIFHRPVIIVDDPVNLQIIYSSPNFYDRSFFFKFFDLADGLITSDVQKWRPDRKMFNQAFIPRLIHSFVPIFGKWADDFAGKLAEKQDQPIENLQDQLQGLSFASLAGATLHGTDEIINKHTESTIEHMNKYLHAVVSRIYRPHLYPNIFFKRSNLYKEMKSSTDFLYSISQQIIDHNRTLSSAASEESDMKNYIDVMANRNFELSTMKDHIMTLLITGTETTAITVHHVLLFVALNPSVQERLLAEIREVFGINTIHCPDVDGLTQLKYMDMVIKETLRLLPTAPVVSRKCTKDTAIGSKIIPKGTDVIISLYTLHRDPKLWGPTANEFDPDRFLPEECSKRHPYAYLPFTAGSRNCIGYKYAMFNMKTTLVVLLSRFIFTTEAKHEDIEPRFGITMKLANPFRLKIVSRNN